MIDASPSGAEGARIPAQSMGIRASAPYGHLAASTSMSRVESPLATSYSFWAVASPGSLLEKLGRQLEADDVGALKGRDLVRPVLADRRAGNFRIAAADVGGIEADVPPGDGQPLYVTVPCTAPSDFVPLTDGAPLPHPEEASRIISAPAVAASRPQDSHRLIDSLP